jgi:predicted dehydrogenase
MAKLNIALIGAGGRGTAVRLSHILVMNDVFNLVAICDRDEAKAREIAAKHNVRAYGRVQDLVQQETLDVAAVSTPGDSHHAICTYLAEHGINIIVETPIAITLPLTDLIIDAVERNGVKLEVAENYPRDAMHMMKRKVIDAGLIGDVLRVYSFFQTGGYHIMSSLRMMAADEAIKVTGIAMNTPIPHVNVSNVRQYTSEDWSMGIIDFANGAMAFTAYSAIYHAGALGRKSATFFQVDGTTGAIVGNDVHLTTEEQRSNGGRATVYPIKVIMTEAEGGRTLDRVEIATDPPVLWENPYPHYKVGLGSLAIIEEMDSIAQAVLNNQPTRYDAHEGRKDMELQIAMGESGRRGRQPLDLPLTSVTPHEEEIHQRFADRYGHDPMDVEVLVDFFFPKT